LVADIQWWSFVISIGAIVVLLAISGFSGYRSLKRDHLINMIKE
jgi:hypothetical protein